MWLVNVPILAKWSLYGILFKSWVTIATGKAFSFGKPSLVTDPSPIMEWPSLWGTRVQAKSLLLMHPGNAESKTYSKPISPNPGDRRSYIKEEPEANSRGESINWWKVASVFVVAMPVTDSFAVPMLESVPQKVRSYKPCTSTASKSEFDHANRIPCLKVAVLVNKVSRLWTYMSSLSIDRSLILWSKQTAPFSFLRPARCWERTSLMQPKLRLYVRIILSGSDRNHANTRTWYPLWGCHVRLSFIYLGYFTVSLFEC